MNVKPKLRATMVIGNSPLMKQTMTLVGKMAPSLMPVLITGPTGAGKEVIASALHRMRDGAHHPFVDLNCAAMPDNLMESLLFGHEKGMFTGAVNRYQGYFAVTGEGSLFLDEIGEMSLAQQAKLLRVIESREFRPLGSAQSLPFQGRIIAATHADLESMVKEGKFREDLYYRLNVLRIEVPSLDKRREDIPEFVEYFLARSERPVRFSREAVATLSSLSWPGNVRQLKSTIDKIALLSDENPVTGNSVKQFIQPPSDPLGHLFQHIAEQVIQLNCENKIGLMEKALIRQALKKANGNKSQAARYLGVHRKYVERRVKA